METKEKQRADEIKSQKLLDICNRMAKVVLVGMMIFAVFVLVYFGMRPGSDRVKIDEVTFIERWTVVEGDGHTFETGRFYLAEKDYEKDFTIISALPENVTDNTFLCFGTGKNVSVYIGGELRKSFDEFRDVNIPGGSVKRFFLLVPLKASDSGMELRIERAATTKRGQIVPESFVGTLGGIYGYLMSRYGLTLMLAEVIMIMSLVVMTVGFIMRVAYRRRINMLYGALGIFIVAAWVMTDSLLFPFVFGVYHVDGVVNYLLCLMIPFGPAIYLNSIQHERYKKSMSAIFIVSTVNAIVWPVLHFAGIFPLYNALIYINILQLVEALVAFLILVIDMKKGYAAEYKYTAIGFISFIVCGLFEIFYLMFMAPKHEELPMVFGLAFFLAFVVLQQVEDLRKTYAEKQHAIDLSQSKSRFLASMSHEIRTPINAILGMNEMILRENRDKVIEEYASGIQSSGKMLLMLVNDVLDFSKIEAGKLEINEAQFRLSELLNDVISLVREQAQEKSLALYTEIQDEIPNGEISDDFRIRQILINLLNNAVKYTDQGSVTLMLGGEYVTEDRFILDMAVKDTGRGIRQEDQPSLFDAFSRADMRKNINIEGTGLGLAIVKSIVDSMHGEIGVESEYGVGSKFWVKIPVGVVDRTPLTRESMERKSAAEHKVSTCDYRAPQAKILAVDDNQSNLTIARLFLKRTQVQADFCDGGEKAIALCKKTKYDLILLDHMMPQPDGVETFHRIKEEPDSLNKTTPVIVLTANAVAGRRQMYLDMGFEDYLSKPLDSAMLEQTMKKYLPKEKIEEITVEHNTDQKEDEEMLEFFPEDYETEKEAPGQDRDDANGLREKLREIVGLDYQVLMTHCARDESIAVQILTDIAKEGPKRCDMMRAYLGSKDYDHFGIDAHAVKGLMATIGLLDLSEWAKRHEAAAKSGDYDYVMQEGESFVKAYEEMCRKLCGCLGRSVSDAF